MSRARPFLVLSLLSLPAFLDAGGVTVLRGVPSTYVYPVKGHIPLNVHRGTQALLSLLLPGARFDDPRGVACALLSSREDPQDPLDDMQITVVGSNRGTGELFYNVGIRKLARLGQRGGGEGRFRDPDGVALHPDGTVAVADAGNHRIVLLHHTGFEVQWREALGREGSAPGEFRGPRGVAFDSRGTLYVADTGNNRLQARDPGGEFRVLQTGGAPLEGPLALAVIDRRDPWTFYREGPYADRLAVLEKGGTRIRTFTLEGDPLAAVTAESLGENVRWAGLAFDYLGNLTVTEPSSGCLRKFDRDLNSITCFGNPGEGDFQFDDPRGVAIHKQLGQVLVVERKSVQYLWIGADVLEPQARVHKGGVDFSFLLTERAYVSAEVRDGKDRKVATPAEKKEMDLGRRTLAWKAEGDVPPGRYALELTVMATYSSRDRVAKAVRLEFEVP